MVATSYPATESDWRGRFIYDMAASLAKRSDVALRLWAPPGPLPAGVEAVATAAESSWLHALAQSGGAAQAYRKGGVARYATPSRLMYNLHRAYRRNSDVDLYHVNWLQNVLPLFGTRKPVLATCLGTDLALMARPAVAWAVRMVLRQRPYVIAPNAGWMRVRLLNAMGDDTPVMPIYFGVHERWFVLAAARRPAMPRQWLAVLRLTKQKLGHLLDWGRQFVAKSDELHLLGPMVEKIDLPDWVQYHGATNPDDLAQNWFPRATALVTLSQHSEGLPQVILDAMAAGLPIIATRIPGHEAAIMHGKTGWLVENERQLAEAIATLRDPECNAVAGQLAHLWVRERVGTWDDCAERFVRGYRQLLDGQAGT